MKTKLLLGLALVLLVTFCRTSFGWSVKEWDQAQGDFEFNQRWSGALWNKADLILEYRGKNWYERHKPAGPDGKSVFTTGTNALAQAVPGTNVCGRSEALVMLPSDWRVCTNCETVEETGLNLRDCLKEQGFHRVTVVVTRWGMMYEMFPNGWPPRSEVEANGRQERLDAENTATAAVIADNKLDALPAFKTIIPETIPHDACSTNMMQLAVWLRIAMGEGDRYPITLASLAVCTNYPNFSNTLLVCPTTGHSPGAMTNVEEWTDYIYVGNGLEGGMCDVALLISPPENHGGKFGYVLWGCGNVTQLDASYVRALIKAPWCLPARARGETFVRDEGFDKFVKPTIKVRIPARFAGIYAGTTNSVEGTNSAEKIPAGYGAPMDVQQVLQIYAELTGANLKLQDGISTNHTFIKFGSYPAMTLAETVAYLEKALREQVEIIAVHKDAGHVELERMKNPEQKR